jgi:methyl-accepting chemotaxis protein
MNINKVKVITFIIPILIFIPVLLCFLNFPKNVILLSQLGLGVVIFIIIAFAFLRPYAKTIKSLQKQKTNGRSFFTDIMAGCCKMQDMLEQQELDKKITVVNEEAREKITSAQNSLELYKTEMSNAMLPIFKIFYEKENDMTIRDKMSHIINELYQSICDIVAKMKSQTELLSLTFDAFDTTTVSLEKVDMIIEKAKGLSFHLQDETGKGRESLIQTRESMKSILESSEKMVRIIAAIEDIAEQTNILSINASIESTHADRGGKGFSVIAKEIRKLAGTSKNSSLEIRQMIEDMIQKIKKQAELVEMVFNIFQQINTYIGETNEINKNIYNISKRGVIQGREMQTAINALSAVAKEIISSSNKELFQANEVLNIMNSFKEVFNNYKSDNSIMKIFQEQNNLIEKK